MIWFRSKKNNKLWVKKLISAEYQEDKKEISFEFEKTVEHVLKVVDSWNNFFSCFTLNILFIVSYITTAETWKY